MISIQCMANMHPACSRPDDCKCMVCRHEQKCRICGQHAPRLYGGGGDLCHRCYRIELAVSKPKPQCMECGEENPYVYREPRSDDDRHLCNGCHRALGHRYQENGMWHEPETV